VEYDIRSRHQLLGIVAESGEHNVAVKAKRRCPAPQPGTVVGAVESQVANQNETHVGAALTKSSRRFDGQVLAFPFDQASDATQHDLI
jgi:hypothetical protein